MTDAINHPELADRGLTILQPDETLTATVDLALMGL
jgi:galactose mutarotase-like enzyme